jgi:hypothetical protein
MSSMVLGKKVMFLISFYFDLVWDDEIEHGEQEIKNCDLLCLYENHLI